MLSELPVNVAYPGCQDAFEIVFLAEVTCHRYCSYLDYAVSVMIPYPSSHIWNRYSYTRKLMQCVFHSFVGENSLYILFILSFCIILVYVLSVK